MLTKNHYHWYEIRACVETEDETLSFTGTNVWCACRETYIGTPASAEAEAEAYRDNNSHRGPSEVFWSLYGRVKDADSGHMLAECIGDFDSFASAYETMNLILAPVAAARDHLWETPRAVPGDVKLAGYLDDIINQSSTDERL